MRHQSINPTPMPRKLSKKERREMKAARKFNRSQDKVYVALRELEGIVSMMERISEYGEQIHQEEVFALSLCFGRLNKSTYNFLEIADSL